MKRLTNKLDFSLTKKRFWMMGKTLNPSKRRGIYTFILPFISITTFLFCTSTESQSQKYIQAFNNEFVFSEPEVFLKLNSEFRPDGYWYDSEGNYISGTVQLFELETGLIKRKDSVIAGLVHKTVFLDENGRSTNVMIKEYSQNKLINETSWLMGDLFWKNTYHTDSLMTSQQYYPDGQLKWEATSVVGTIPNTRYQGYMTLYDAQGNIEQQELYENGELVEKIK
ncbi:MAG: hypothetical protein MI700_00015 [Balneolales bacterium]|nr:hypothetical protein [Balneolales bacterium]